MWRTSFSAAIAVVLIIPGRAQVPAPAAPAAFEAASVRQNTGGGLVSGLQQLPGGRFNVTNMPLAGVIAFAYQLQLFELFGGPPWVTADRWDIVARLAGDPPPDAPGRPSASALATRALLSERFKLVLRRDRRDVDTYALVLARTDGRLGAGLIPSSTDCAAVRLAANEAQRTGAVAPTPNTPDKVVCGIRNNGRRIQFGGYPVADFAGLLAGLVQRRVIDRTGLTGDWELDISFNPDGLGQRVATGDAQALALDAASLFTVIQEQLGLKLQPERVSMEVTVVDRVERPAVD